MKEEKVLQLEDEIEDLELECATDDVIGKAQQTCKFERNFQIFNFQFDKFFIFYFSREKLFLTVKSSKFDH